MKETQVENKIISKEQKTPQEIILEIIFKDCPSVLTRKQAQEKVLHALDMLTPTEKSQLSERLLRCDFFLERANKGMDLKKVRSLLSRKYDIARQNLSKVCEPCEFRLKSLD